MKTLSVNIENLCAPCHCGCRHCLLNSQHRATGVAYQTGEAFARKFFHWMKENYPEQIGMYYVGYCMDFPELPQYIKYFKEQTGMDHLMFDGMSIRTPEETEELLLNIRDAGIRELHFTFYGTETYHDRFAGRKGDFAYMMQVARLAQAMELKVTGGIMLTRENKDQMEDLFAQLRDSGVQDLAVILPHAKGRGEAMSHLHLREEDLQDLPKYIQDMLPANRYRTEKQWIQEGNFPKATGRHVTLALTPENIDRLEAMDPGEIIRELEAMDDCFHSHFPEISTLAAEYGQPENTQLFRYRDLVLQWQKRYMKDHPIFPDMTDESGSFSTRVYP